MTSSPEDASRRVDILKFDLMSPDEGGEVEKVDRMRSFFTKIDFKLQKTETLNKSDRVQT